jgi:hypothetical protein
MLSQDEKKDEVCNDGFSFSCNDGLIIITVVIICDGLSLYNKVLKDMIYRKKSLMEYYYKKCST